MVAFLLIPILIFLILRFEPVAKLLVGHFAQQALADGRNADESNVKIDKRIGWISRFRSGGSLGIARLLEGLVDVADGEAKPPY